jgi:hypothetical protein
MLAACSLAMKYDVVVRRHACLPAAEWAIRHRFGEVSDGHLSTRACSLFIFDYLRGKSDRDMRATASVAT